VKLPTIYRHQGHWWHGDFGKWESDTNLKLIRELFWLICHGTWYAGWNWPQLVFGFGRMWFNGPHWHLNLGVFSVSLSYN
jgi:hypothetical protein